MISTRAENKVPTKHQYKRLQFRVLLYSFSPRKVRDFALFFTAYPLEILTSLTGWHKKMKILA